MSYTINENRTYDVTAETLKQAVLAAISGLEGKMVKDETMMAKATFHKTIHGKVLGDRTHLTVNLTEKDGAKTGVDVEVYPLDAIGRPLQFGAREGVSQTIMTWFFAHLEHNLKS